MDFSKLFSLLADQITHTHIWEWIAVTFGVTEVLLAKRNHVLLYPAGIISVTISIFLLLNVKLYAESLLSVYYLIMSIYGWAIWKTRKNLGGVQVSWSDKKDWLVAFLIAVPGFFLLFFVLKNYTDSNVPFLDAFVSSTAWAGMWLLAKRKIENWVWLNISNLVAIPLLFYKQLPLFGFLTIFLFIIAIFGFIDWIKIWKNHHLPSKISSNDKLTINTVLNV